MHRALPPPPGVDLWGYDGYCLEEAYMEVWPHGRRKRRVVARLVFRVAITQKALQGGKPCIELDSLVS